MPNPYMFVNFGLMDTEKTHGGDYGIGYNVYIKKTGSYGVDSLSSIADLYKKPGKLIGFLNPSDAKDFYYRFIELLEYNNKGKPKWKQNKPQKRYASKDPDFRNVLEMIEIVEGGKRSKPRRRRHEYWQNHERRIRDWARPYKDAYIRIPWVRGIKRHRYGWITKGYYVISFIPTIKTHVPFLQNLESMDLEQYGL